MSSCMTRSRLRCGSESPPWRRARSRSAIRFWPTLPTPFRDRLLDMTSTQAGLRPYTGARDGDIPGTSPTVEQPPYLVAAAVSLGALIIYILTLAPTTQFWDTSEYIAAAYTLGIPHPPGNPLFVLIAHVFGLLPLAAGYAARINLFAAVTSAVSAGCWFLVAERWLRSFVPALWPRRLAALAGALVFAIALVYAFAAGNVSFAVAALLVAVVGVSVYTFLPIRAAFHPPINEGEPTNWQALWAVLTRQQYGKPSIFDNPTQAPGFGNPGHTAALYWGQLLNYAQYVSWQFAHDWSDRVQRVLAVLFAFLGISGAIRHWRADRRTAIAMPLLMFTFTFALVFYLNFKYGYSLHPGEPLAAHAVRQRDYFFLVSFALWGIWVAMGLAAGIEWVGQWFRERQPNEARRWVYGTPLLALALIPLIGNRHAASRKNERLARDFAYDLLQSVEPYGVLVTAGDNDTFPLWYAQEVEGIRKDVTIVNLSLANTDWYTRQLQNRPLATFDSTNAPAIYRGRQWPKPAGQLMSFTDAQLAGLEPYYILEGKRTAHLGAINVTLDPQMLGHPYLERADVIVLQVIKDQLGKRPIYFSRTVGLYGDQFGLTSRLEGQGFARVLREHELTPSDSIKGVQSLGYVNLPRTSRLLFDVYHADAAARERPRGWVDKPSEGILSLYGLTYYTMAEALQGTKSAESARMQQIAQAVFRNTDRTVQPLPEPRGH